MKCKKFYNVINEADVPFAQIPNELLRDKNISIEARGLLSLMLSHDSKVWNYRAEHLMDQGKMKKTKYQRILKELEKYGYIRRQHVKDEETGKLLGTELLISNKSGTYSESRKTRLSENPTVGKRPTKNTKKFKKTIYKETPVSKFETGKSKSKSKPKKQTPKAEKDKYGIEDMAKNLDSTECKQNPLQMMQKLAKSMTVN